jgi:hypothetical protein
MRATPGEHRRLQTTGQARVSRCGNPRARGRHPAERRGRGGGPARLGFRERRDERACGFAAGARAARAPRRPSSGDPSRGCRSLEAPTAQ